MIIVVMNIDPVINMAAVSCGCYILTLLCFTLALTSGTFLLDTTSLNIGSNSCRGTSSCFPNFFQDPFPSTIYIAEDSCQGEYACYKTSGNIGNESCNADYACEYNSGNSFVSLCLSSLTVSRSNFHIISNVMVKCKIGHIGDGQW